MGIASGMKDITQEIATSYEARIAEVGKLKEQAKNMLDCFQASHREMGTELRKRLAQSEVQRKKASVELKKQLTGGVAARKREVKGMLNGFQSSHKAMSTELRRSLAQSEVQRKKASAELKKELGDYVRGIKGEVAGMRQEARADLREASATWQELAATMQAKRAGVKMPPEVKPRVEEKVEVPVAEEVPIEEKVEAAPVEEEVLDLEAKLLAAIRERPAGVTLAEVAESLGVAPIVLGRASRSLLEKGKIRREEKLYFPVTTEEVAR